MASFSKGDVIPMESGKHATILSKEPLGSGGQGEVYLVKYGDSEYALKWYVSSKIIYNHKFRDNLKLNAETGAPNDRFAWPVDVTKEFKGSYGYVMPLLPKENEDFSDYLRTYKITKTKNPKKIPVVFSSYDCIINAALQIVDAFMALHRRGLSYQDLNDGGISMDMETGDILICDCDNIAADGSNFGILGKQGYMAPEIVLSKNPPNVYSDRFSLAIVLFKLFFRDDPLWGKRVSNCCNLTDFYFNKFYGEDPVFIYHPTDTSNRPVPGVCNNVMRLWDKYPSYIQNLFQRAFVDGVKEPSKRPIETEWLSAIIRLRSEAFRCSCGGFSFVSDVELKNGSYACPRCGASYPVMMLGTTRLPLAKGAVAYQCQTRSGSDDYRKVTMTVVENRIKKGLLGLKNLDDVSWDVFYDDDRQMIGPGKGTEIRPGMRIEFDRKTKGTVLRRE